MQYIYVISKINLKNADNDGVIGYCASLTVAESSLQTTYSKIGFEESMHSVVNDWKWQGIANNGDLITIDCEPLHEIPTHF